MSPQRELELTEQIRRLRAQHARFRVAVLIASLILIGILWTGRASERRLSGEEFEEFIDGPGSTARGTRVTISPGVRGGWNIGDHQLILGMAVPVRLTEGERDPAILSYVSYELPFRKP